MTAQDLKQRHCEAARQPWQSRTKSVSEIILFEEEMISDTWSDSTLSKTLACRR
jgi:hypothetical protein